MAVKIVQKNEETAVAKKSTKKKDLSPAQTLCAEARLAYRDFQFGWFSFAKKITEIQKTEAYIEAKYESFKSYCQDEFPDIPFSTISKFITVVESWGPTLEARVSKAPDEPLPSYDACYDVAVVEEKIPKEEVPKLRKDILERKISRAEVRERLRDFRRPRNPAGTTAKGEAALDKELKASEAKTKEALRQEADNLTVAADMKSEQLAEQMLVRLKMAFDAMPTFTKGLKEASPKVIELAEFLRDNGDKFNEAVDAFLTRVEDLAEEEG